MIKDEENTSAFSFQAHKNIVRPITGLKEPIIKSLRKIKTSGGRAKEGLYLVEGANLCSRAVHYGAEVVALICADGYVQQDECIQLRNLLSKKTTIYSCSEGMLHKCLEICHLGACSRILHIIPMKV